MLSISINKTLSLINVPSFKQKLNQCYENISATSSYSSIVGNLRIGYRTLKDASDMICMDRSNVFYKSLKDRIIDCEYLVDEKFIVDCKANFDVMDPRFYAKPTLKINKKDFLDYIIWFTRSRLLSCYEEDRPNVIINFDELHFTNDCKFSASVIKLICESLDIECEIVKLPPAFTDEYKLYGGNGFHYFCFVTIDGIKYIVDTTYKQFFTLDNNLLDRMGVMGLDGCSPGVYMNMNKSRRNTARQILTNGYAVATYENLKNYFDGFLLSYRNGLFYESFMKEVNYNVPYTVEDYFKFINGDELLFDYEPIEFIGQQLEPLKNKNLLF